MSSLTMRQGAPGAALATAPGLFSRLLHDLIAAREKAARHRAAELLSVRSDERLRDLGLIRADIEAIRAGTFTGPRL